MEELYDLQLRLYEETDQLKAKFASLIFDLQEDLEEKLQVDKLVDFLIHYNPAFEVQLRECTNFSEVFRKIRHFVSFFDYDILEHLIRKFCLTGFVEKELQAYKVSFEAYSERLVRECPSNAFGDPDKSEKVFVIISDKTIDNMTIKKLRKFKHNLNKILGNKLAKILCIEGGSIKLVFRTFEDYDLKLTEQQCLELRNEDVISITYGKQYIEISKSGELEYLT